MTVEVAPGPVPVFVAADDLATCADVLLGNVFAHTPEGVAFAVRLSHRAAGGAWLVVADDGPGFGDADPTRRGQSSGGSTGLGLDIARRIAEASGGTLVIGRSPSGGGSVTLGLGSPAGPPEETRRHRRARLRLRVLPRHKPGFGGLRPVRFLTFWLPGVSVPVTKCTGGGIGEASGRVPPRTPKPVRSPQNGHRLNTLAGHSNTPAAWLVAARAPLCAGRRP